MNIQSTAILSENLKRHVHSSIKTEEYGIDWLSENRADLKEISLQTTGLSHSLIP